MKIILGIATGAFLMNWYIFHGLVDTLSVLTFGLILAGLVLPQKKTSDGSR